ncbi:MAG: AAA family ATPase [Spirochaetaceae bacterium]|nr:AAA family ATPase [Spirochaetaceae bacterium]
MPNSLYYSLWQGSLTAKDFKKATFFLDTLAVLNLPVHYRYAALKACANLDGNADEQLAAGFLVALVFYNYSLGSLALPAAKVTTLAEEWVAALTLKLAIAQDVTDDQSAEQLSLMTELTKLTQSKLSDLLAGNWHKLPLFMDNKGLIYLSGHRHFEEELKTNLLNFLKTDSLLLMNNGWPAGLSNSLANSRLVSDKDDPQALYHKIFEAVPIILAYKLLILTGGPGYGKTTALSYIIEGYLLANSNKDLAIYLTAPTGRAASRMAEELQRNEAIKPYIKATGTLHKLLGYNPGDAGYYYNEEHKLKADLIAIDESSMLDFYLFNALLKALPADCRLILIGDANQLPSVGVGAILTELLHSKPLQPQVVSLTKCYRSDRQILNFATAVLGAKPAAIKAAKEELVNTQSDKVTFYNFNQLNYTIFIKQQADYYKNLFNDTQSHKLYEALAKFIIITPLRSDGLYSSDNLNTAISEGINKKDIYTGLPIMVTANLPNLELNNGDRAVIIEQDGSYLACFGDKVVPLALINHWQVAYAITVHKSQGSEFNEVCLVIPYGSQRLFDNKLFYTALTRAKTKVRIFADDEELINVKAGRARYSGLFAKN